jgi:hypothetical protein
MIQCLHERELVEPYRHTMPGSSNEGEKGDAKPAGGKPSAEEPADDDMEEKPDMPADDDNPFADKPAGDDEMADE